MEYENKRINFKYNLKEYFSFISKYKFLLISLIILIIINESFTLVNSFLFKNIVDSGAKYLSSELSKPDYIQILIYIAIAFAVFTILRSVIRVINVHLINILETRTMYDLKIRYFNHILGLSHKFHTTHKTGSLISRLGRGVGAMETLTDVFIFQLMPLTVQLIVIGISISYFNLITGMIVILMAISFVLYSWYLQRKQEKYKLAQNKVEDLEKGFVGDIFTNIDSVKYFGKEKKIRDSFQLKVDTTRKATLETWKFYKWFDSILMLIIALGTFLIIYFSLRSFLIGELTLGELTFIYSVCGSLIGPMFNFAFGLRGFYRAMADFQDLFEYGKIENDIKDDKNAKDLLIKRGEIEFKNVSFDYGKRKLFEGFNLKIKPHEKVALVGHSGCGKTSLLKLLYRFYDIPKGEILVDNKNINSVKQESLRSEMSIVPQEAILFDDTIYNNVAFTNPKATREDVLNAIKFAQLDKIIENFPEKENTIVGERGVKLSGGEKQRVSIARAILADKKILVLDEATSSLDSETESEIQKDLARLLKDRTSIIIAHRLSTIMSADRIIVMKQGKIVEEGNHEKLISLKGEYYKLWKLQKGGYIK